MSSIKSMLGHTMGAASAIEAVACVAGGRSTTRCRRRSTTRRRSRVRSRLRPQRGAVRAGGRRDEQRLRVRRQQRVGDLPEVPALSSGTSRRGVVITGMGVVCPLGDRADAVFDALCEGRTAFGSPTVFDAAALPGHVAAEVPEFAPEKYVRPGNIRPLDRTGRLALVGVELALADSGWTLDARKESLVGLVRRHHVLQRAHDRRVRSARPAGGTRVREPDGFRQHGAQRRRRQVAIWHRPARRQLDDRGGRRVGRCRRSATRRT